MASRKEEREQLRQLRQEKEAEQKGRERTRLIAAYAGGGVLVLLIVVGAVIAIAGSGGGDSGKAHVSLQSGQTNGIALDERVGTEPPELKAEDLRAAVQEARCELRENLPEEGRTHLEPGTPPPTYKTNPPTSGNHVAPPYQQADGAYIDPPDQMNVVHSLEHGRMTIQYNPNLPEAEQLELRGFYDTVHAGALLFPNPDMPYAVAIVSWRNMLVCNEYKGAATLAAAKAFGAKHFGTGPEPVNGFGPLAGPTFGDKS